MAEDFQQLCETGISLSTGFLNNFWHLVYRLSLDLLSHLSPAAGWMPSVWFPVQGTRAAGYLRMRPGEQPEQRTACKSKKCERKMNLFSPFLII